MVKRKDEFDLDDLKINYIDIGEEREIRAKKIINICFGAVALIAILVFIDIFLVAKFNVGPFFAIRTKKYDDGGTRVYYGLGYKVIKYHQQQGRRDTVVGRWNMPYSIEPTDVQLVDLAIELETNPTENYKKFAKKFIRVSGKVDSVDVKNNSFTIKYNDDGGKYTLVVRCYLASDYKNISKIKKGSTVYIIGTISRYEVGTKKQSNTLYIKNCFAE